MKMVKKPPAHERLIVALDVADPETADHYVTQLADTVGFYKIGMQLQFAGGLDYAQRLIGRGKRVFLDVKLLDIDHTVEKAVENIAKIGVSFVTIHAFPGAMRAAVAGRGGAALKLLGVTVLTNLDDRALTEAGYGRIRAEDLVALRARAARAAGMDGIICSPREAQQMRSVLGPERLIVTPGIRAPGEASGDQKRTASAREAIANGADHIVVGRPILKADDPVRAVRQIIAEIEAAPV